MSAKLAEADVNKLHYPENKTVKKLSSLVLTRNI